MIKKIIGNATLYYGDTMNILPQLGVCADLVATDPPYLLTSGGNNQDWTLGDGYNNNGSIVQCDIIWRDFMPLLFNCLRNESHAYVMSNNRHVEDMLSEARWAGFKFHNLLVWDKLSATPNRWYMKNCEFTGFFYKGKAKHINNCGDMQLIRCPQENYGTHPTTKPVALMRHYIENSTTQGQMVIDPFMGVGATGVAAIESGRKFIGIEIDEKYFNQACERISKCNKQSALF
jgi:DNA modification methylase